MGRSNDDRHRAVADPRSRPLVETQPRHAAQNRLISHRTAGRAGRASRSILPVRMSFDHDSSCNSAGRSECRGSRPVGRFAVLRGGRRRSRSGGPAEISASSRRSSLDNAQKCGQTGHAPGNPRAGSDILRAAPDVRGRIAERRHAYRTLRTLTARRLRRSRDCESLQPLATITARNHFVLPHTVAARSM